MIPEAMSEQYMQESWTVIWRNAFTATFLISFFPTLVLFLIPSKYLYQSIAGINIQHVLLSFAAGGLLGDVFIHAIPHLMSDGGHDQQDSCNKLQILKKSMNLSASPESTNEHEHFRSIFVGVFVLLGFILFFMSEKIVSRQIHFHFHKSSSVKCNGTESEDSANTGAASTSNVPTIRKRNTNTNFEESAIAPAGDTTTSTSSFLKQLSEIFVQPSFESLNIACCLNLFADTLHNFTDGIALGASFASGKSLAVATTLSIFFHEIPHELSDFSILIESGFSKSSAIAAQFVTAIAAFIGTFIGLAAKRNETMEDIFLAVTAGGFVYVATVGVVPVMLSKGHSSWVQLSLEFVGFCSGVALMVLVALFESSEE